VQLTQFAAFVTKPPLTGPGYGPRHPATALPRVSQARDALNRALART